jgi:hypothetical protein
MAFQIQTPEGVAIPLNKLDEEAAAFWRVPTRVREYVKPSNGKDNWFDSIGWYISSPRLYYATSWDNVKCNIYSILLMDLALYTMDVQLLKVKEAFEYAKPYFDLIDHWKEKGYIPVQVKD